MSDNVDLSFMNISLDDAKEPEILEDGKEVQAEVTGVNIYPDSSMLIIKMKPLNVEGFFRQIRHQVFFPKIGPKFEKPDDAEKINNKKLAIQDTLKAFGLDERNPTLLTEENLVGKTTWLIVRYEEARDQYSAGNSVKQFVPRSS